MENLNRVLLENVLPAHVAEHFLARNWKNEVRMKMERTTKGLACTALYCLYEGVCIPNSHGENRMSFPTSKLPQHCVIYS